MRDKIRNCFTWYANRIAEAVQYTTWSDECCRKYVKEVTDEFLAELETYIDWNHLTRDEAYELRFKLWREDQPDLYLVPLYILPILPIGTELTCINGDKVVYDGSNVDNDIRYGCIAYGIEIKE